MGQKKAAPGRRDGGFRKLKKNLSLEESECWVGGLTTKDRKRAYQRNFQTAI